MGETQPPRHTGRSIGAVVAGFVIVVILSLGTDVLMHVVGLFPPLGQPMPDKLLLLATSYRTLYGVVGSYITAWLAPRRPMLHSLAGGVVGLVLSSAGAAATWNLAVSVEHHWYPLALIVTVMPTAWAGGKLRVTQLSTRVQI